MHAALPTRPPPSLDGTFSHATGVSASMWIGARRFGTIVALPAALAAPCRLSKTLDALTGRNTTAAKLHIDNYLHILSQVHGNAHVEPGPAAYPGPRYRIVPLHSSMPCQAHAPQCRMEVCSTSRRAALTYHANTASTCHFSPCSVLNSISPTARCAAGTSHLVFKPG
jgi:hypothetical protein